ncbi:MAG TPA: cytochrome c [Geminicoccaceae bacterium]|nr:cytochrome c [Geminicoccaceae bacterium]
MAGDPISTPIRGRGLRGAITGAPTLLLALLLIGAGAATAQQIEFRHPLDNEPLEVPLPEGDKLTEAVAEFHRTGQNLHVGDEQAIAAGKRIYARWCQACHMPDGSGRMGPSLIDEVYNHPRTNTDVGMFEIIYAGGTGAMQAFHPRLSQDEILQVIAYIHELGK